MQTNKINATDCINFGTLKSLKFQGQYRKNPCKQIELIKAMESNKAIKKIYEDYDVEILFDTCKSNKKTYSFMEFWCKKHPETFYEKFKSLFQWGYFLGIDTNDDECKNLSEATELLANKIATSKKKFILAKQKLDTITNKNSQK